MRKDNNRVVEALRRAHDALIEDLEQLNRAADGADLTALPARLAATRTHVADHFRFEEENGYMAEVRAREPRLEHAINSLAAQHRELLQSLDTLISRATATKSLDTAIRESVKEWVRHIRRHEADENDLMQDAYNFDIGAED